MNRCASPDSAAGRITARWIVIASSSSAAVRSRTCSRVSRTASSAMNPAMATRTTVLTATDVRNPIPRRRAGRRGVLLGMFVVTLWETGDSFSDPVWPRS